MRTVKFLSLSSVENNNYCSFFQGSYYYHSCSINKHEDMVKTQNIKCGRDIYIYIYIVRVCVCVCVCLSYAVKATLALGFSGMYS